jgi:hypothetical protein
MVHIHSRLAEPRFRIPRTRGDPYGAHSFSAGGTYVSHSQNERRALLCTLILGWRNLGFAFPEREANHMVHTHSGVAKPRFRIRRKKGEPDAAHSVWVGDT